jgi:hypothetical protein
MTRLRAAARGRWSPALQRCSRPWAQLLLRFGILSVVVLVQLVVVGTSRLRGGSWLRTTFEQLVVARERLSEITKIVGLGRPRSLRDRLDGDVRYLGRRFHVGHWLLFHGLLIEDYRDLFGGLGYYGATSQRVLIVARGGLEDGRYGGRSCWRSLQDRVVVSCRVPRGLRFLPDPAQLLTSCGRAAG